MSKQGFTHRFIRTNGLRMHLTEAGSGPLVILCHGFSDLGYCWRHQVRALAEAGYHAVAPDLRGYGQTDAPEAIESYGLFELVADMVGLIQTVGEGRKAVLVGHDWGASLSWYTALLRPDLVRALTIVSVPYVPTSWDEPLPSAAMRQLAGDKIFYQTYFQEPGKAEAELEADVRSSLLRLYYSASGDPPPEERWRYLIEPPERFIDTGTLPSTLPSWLSEADLDFCASEFSRTGFRGPLNWYRNIDRRWRQTRFLAGARWTQPTLFMAGDVDKVFELRRTAYERLEEAIPNLRRKVLLAGAGHWLQQERPQEVNRLLLEFLNELDEEG